MSVRVAVVTGSNKGIGLSTVKFLCQKFDGDVILCSRDKSRGEAAVATLKEQGLNPKLALLDISNRSTIEDLRDRLVKDYGGLDVLINNAAIAFPRITDVPFQEQANRTLQVNYFDTVAVCDILFPILRPHARVVNVSSSLGMLYVVPGSELRERLASSHLTRHDIDSLAYEFLKDVETGAHLEKGWPNSAYGTSKVLLSALSFAQHRHFQQNDPREDIVVNVVHPGYVDTDMTNHRGVFKPDDGCQSSIKGALVPKGGEPRGQFIWSDCSIVDWANDKKPALARLDAAWDAFGLETTESHLIHDHFVGWVFGELDFDVKDMYFDAHDTDRNEKLDGLELLQALHHQNVTQHQKSSESHFIEDSIIVDSLLEQADSDKNGFIDYSEYILSRKRYTSV